MRPRAACTASESAWSTLCRARRSSRSPATSELYRQTFSRGEPTSPLEERGPTPNRRGTTIVLRARHRDFRRRGAVQAGPALPARPVQGLSVRRGRDTLALRSVADRRFHAGRGGVPVPGRPRRPSQGADRRPQLRHRGLLHRPAGLSRTARAWSNGRWPGRCGPRAAPLIIATPSRPPTAAPTSRGSGRR